VCTLEPRSEGWRSFAWQGGVFDAGRRPFTRVVHGALGAPHDLVLVTLRGGARHAEIVTDLGHRYAGAEPGGAVSFVPAHCERRLTLRDVRMEWASIVLRPALFENLGEDGERFTLGIGPFTNVRDDFIAALVGEMDRLHAEDGRLDTAYCETMAHALVAYLARRYGRSRLPTQKQPWKLAPWRIRRITEYVEAHIGREISIAELARLVGVTEGHLHRAFRATTGMTPLSYIVQRRIQHAAAILRERNITIAELAQRVGFVSASHFSRTFRRVVGMSPARFRASCARD